MSSGMWGGGPWGAGSWGGGGGSGVAGIIDAQPVRENVVRVEFASPVYFSGLLDPFDAGDPTIWRVTPIAGTSGYDGEDARTVGVVEIRLPGEADGVEVADAGRFVDLWLDRPMSPYPSRYTAELVGSTLTADLATEYGPQTFDLWATFKILQIPTASAARPVRDFASPQNIATTPGTDPSGTSSPLFGSFPTDASGDYAFDEFPGNLRKRALRRMSVRKNAFAHLPGYGVGIIAASKRLGSPVVVQGLVSDAQLQLGLEPDVAKVVVRASRSAEHPDLTVFRAALRPKVGKSIAFELPVRGG